MIDRSMLMDALTINGLEPESSDEEIMSVLTSLGYNLKKREEALKIIRTKFPAPKPYAPENLEKIKVMPIKRIKIERVKYESETPQGVAPEPIKIPWIKPKEEVKVTAPLRPIVNLPKVTGNEDEIKKALDAKPLKFLTFSDQLKLFSKDYVHTEETLKQKHKIELKLFLIVAVLIFFGASGGVYFDMIVIFISKTFFAGWGGYFITLPPIV
ncbi:MAG: hypothetical protein WCI52_00065 [bacterium]